MNIIRLIRVIRDYRKTCRLIASLNQQMNQSGGTKESEPLCLEYQAARGRLMQHRRDLFEVISPVTEEDMTG